MSDDDNDNDDDAADIEPNVIGNSILEDLDCDGDGDSIMSNVDTDHLDDTAVVTPRAIVTDDVDLADLIDLPCSSTSDDKKPKFAPVPKNAGAVRRRTKIRRIQRACPINLPASAPSSSISSATPPLHTTTSSTLPARTITANKNTVNVTVANQLLSSFANQPAKPRGRHSAAAATPTPTSAANLIVPNKDRINLPDDLMSVTISEPAKTHACFSDQAAVAAARINSELKNTAAGSDANTAMQHRMLQLAVHHCIPSGDNDLHRFLQRVPLTDRHQTCNKMRMRHAPRPEIELVSLQYLRRQMRSPIIQNGEFKCTRDNTCIAVTKCGARSALMQYQSMRVRAELDRHRQNGTLSDAAIHNIYNRDPWHLPFCVICILHDTSELYFFMMTGGDTTSTTCLPPTPPSSPSHTSSSSSSSSSSSCAPAVSSSSSSSPRSSLTSSSELIDDINHPECYQVFQVAVDMDGEYDSKYCLPLHPTKYAGVYAPVPMFNPANYTAGIMDINNYRVNCLIESDRLIYKGVYPEGTTTNFH